MKFSITQELKTMGDIYAVRNKILDGIPETILFTKSKEELCFYVLNEFDFPTGIINKSDINSLENGCKTILALMGIDDEFEENLRFVKEEKFDNQLDRFLYYFLDFIGLPGIYKEQLKFKVKMDLDTIKNLIANYEKIDLISKGETPRNHNQRTQSDFYKRCLKEKVKVENHLSSGINERAMSKARRDRLWGMSEMMFEEFRDRPYKLPMHNSSEHFNIEKIDKVGHRLGEITISKGRELKKLYKDDKRQFYTELEILIPDDKVLGVMQQQIDFMPFIPEQRKEIFKELVDLYKNKKWFGFYALSLTQIEGLFTEMCRMCEPRYNSPYAGLPDKVNTVRPYHQFSENRFDYFQYHLPNLRNRFLHFGLDTNEKIEILCKELLWDLEEVVSIFSSLNIDALWFLRLIRKRDDVEFMSVSGLCFYFKMLASVKQKKQFQYFELEVKSLNEIYLPNVVYNVVFDLETKITELIERIYEPVKIQSAANGFEVDLKTITFKEITNNKDKIKAELQEVFNWQYKSELEELTDTLMFIKSYKKNLDLNYIEDNVQTQIDEIDKKYGDFLKKIRLIELYINHKQKPSL
jgi:hypothetical protein